MAAPGCAQISGVDDLAYDRKRDAGMASDAPADADDHDEFDTQEQFDGPTEEDGPSPDVDVPDGPSGTPYFGELKLRCKLINGKSRQDPTANNTHYRANLSGSSLGISVVQDNQLFLFFGDTLGAEKIWQSSTSLPDAVGYAAVDFASVADDPDLLCTELRFLLSGDKTGNVEGDFAGARMKAPAGSSLKEFIHNPAGPLNYAMQPDMPGTLEVPSGAFSHDGSIYLFYTIVSTITLQVGGSYLAKWETPSTTGDPTYQILYHVDQRFTSNGPLGGNFINIAPLVEGEYVYLFGTGKYRNSPVYLARKRLSELAEEGGFEAYDPAMSSWVEAGTPTAPVVAMPSIGELSVQYFPEIQRYVMIDQEVNAGNRIVARFAEKPQGPFSNAVTMAVMEDPAFEKKYCCDAKECVGDKIIQCDQAGFFGVYLLPTVTVHPNASFTLYFTMSTWQPYNVVLMSATFK